MCRGLQGTDKDKTDSALCHVVLDGRVLKSISPSGGYIWVVWHELTPAYIAPLLQIGGIATLKSHVLQECLILEVFGFGWEFF